jgi:hypothetical protein
MTGHAAPAAPGPVAVGQDVLDRVTAIIGPAASSSPDLALWLFFLDAHAPRTSAVNRPRRRPRCNPARQPDGRPGQERQPPPSPGRRTAGLAPGNRGEQALRTLWDARRAAAAPAERNEPPWTCGRRKRSSRPGPVERHRGPQAPQPGLPGRGRTVLAGRARLRLDRGRPLRAAARLVRRPQPQPRRRVDHRVHPRRTRRDRRDHRRPPGRRRRTRAGRAGHRTSAGTRGRGPRPGAVRP